MRTILFRVISNSSEICSTEDEVKAAYDAYFRVDELERYLCTQPCRSMAISLDNIGKDDLSTSEEHHKITFQFKPWAKISQQTELYPFLSLFAEVGGYTGILCGYSILYLVETVYTYINIKK